MNIPHMLQAADSLDAAIFATINPERRKVLSGIRRQLRAELQQCGVFYPTGNETPEETLKAEQPQKIELATLYDGQVVRYRTATRDDDSGMRPQWSGWKEGQLYLIRRAVPHVPGRRPSHQRNAIISLGIANGGTVTEFTVDDYEPDCNEWTKDNGYRLQFEPLYPEAKAQRSEPEMFWCVPCKSYHVDPRDEAHHKALKCFKPWADWQKEQQA